ncbi:MAG: hypothetical protein RBR40_08240 [Tenuifilaceae bacterium]|nr:hypothetical protein [Tenuifilaceae bacterium]
MARTINDIYQQMLAAKEADSRLSVLTSNSLAGIWKLLLYVAAAAVWAVEEQFDMFKAELTDLLESKKPGTLKWYRQQALNYRHGADVMVDGYGVFYAAADETPQLLAECSVRESGTGLVIKVAKLVGATLAPLDAGEYDAFTYYMSLIKYAGTPLRFINSPPNKLKLQAVVYYDPLYIAATGTSLQTGTKLVEQAVENYLRELPFDGRLEVNELIATMRLAEGVRDVYISAIEHQFADDDYVRIVTSHIAESGYFAIDTAFPLADNLTYTPYV